MDLNNIVITSVVDTMTISVKKGSHRQIPNRKYYGLTFCSEGKIKYTHNGQNYISDSGHALILPKGQTYVLEGIETGDFPVINFDCANESCVNGFQIFNIDNVGEIIRSYLSLQELVLFKSVCYNTKAMSIFYDIISNLLVNDKITKEYQLLYPAIIYLKDNFSDSLLSIELLAKEAGISVSYFRRLFKAVYGVSPVKYLQEIRIKKAKQMLNVSRPFMAAISDECGFSSVYHFCRSFKAHVGCTATEYHEKHGLFGL